MCPTLCGLAFSEGERECSTLPPLVNSKYLLSQQKQSNKTLMLERSIVGFQSNVGEMSKILKDRLMLREGDGRDGSSE